MTNELLEQWRKKATSNIVNWDDIPEDEETAYRLGYIEGCKATHEKMQKEHSKTNKECDLLHECISKLYNYDINVPEIKECLSKIKNL